MEEDRGLDPSRRLGWAEGLCACRGRRGSARRIERYRGGREDVGSTTQRRQREDIERGRARRKKMESQIESSRVGGGGKAGLSLECFSCGCGEEKAAIGSKGDRSTSEMERESRMKGGGVGRVAPGEIGWKERLRESE